MLAVFLMGFVVFGLAGAGLYLAFRHSRRQCAGCELLPSAMCRRASLVSLHAGPGSLRRHALECAK